MGNTVIRSIHARHLIDCKTRGLLEVDVITEGGAAGRASAPTGTSVGEGESFVMRDGAEGRFCGTSVYRAVDIVNNKIAPALIGKDAADQEGIDKALLEMDGTPLKTKLGGNSLYSVSAACLAAAAAAGNQSVHRFIAGKEIQRLPVPIVNMFNGGVYPDVKMEFQEFGVVPYGAEDMQEAVDIAVTVFHKIGKMIPGKNQGKMPAIANYFGHCPISDNPMDLFETIAEAVESCGYKNKVCYYTDCAASEFYNPERGTYLFMGKERDRDELLAFVSDMTEKLPFCGVEDILEEHDFEGFAIAADLMPDVKIIGDDLLCTNIQNLKKAVEMKACSGIVLKPNQIGTITEAFLAYRYAKEHNMWILPSVRAGGTVDDIVKEIAVGIEAPLVKCGAPRSGERISFLNTLMRAADEYPQARLSEVYRR